MATKKTFAVETTLEEHKRAMTLLDKFEGSTNQQKLTSLLNTIEQNFESEDDGHIRGCIASIEDSFRNITLNVNTIITHTKEKQCQAASVHNEEIKNLEISLKASESAVEEMERKLADENAARKSLEDVQGKAMQEIDALRVINENQDDLIKFQRDQIARLEREVNDLKSQIIYLQEPSNDVNK